jgi:hypothetical protein
MHRVWYIYDPNLVIRMAALRRNCLRRHPTTGSARLRVGKDQFEKNWLSYSKYNIKSLILLSKLLFFFLDKCGL